MMNIQCIGVPLRKGPTFLTRCLRRMSSSSQPPKTGIVMLNMGGPANLDQVEFFLRNLFEDGEIIQLGKMQNVLGPIIAKRRTPKITKQYAAIGGGSPIGKWTDLQGTKMCEILDEISPETAPHKHYIAFRYAHPLSEQALTEMKRDGVKRAVAFSQYPQWSCTTAGSSMNHLWRELRRLNMGEDFQWSLIDRWNTHPGYIDAMSTCIRRGLEAFEPADRDKVIIIFTAHSVPMMVVNRGDPYVKEIASSAELIMANLRLPNTHVLAWQSKVGFLPWMGPSTSDVIKGLGRQGHKHVLLVPIAFTSDHIETLFEIDIEYQEEAHEAGIKHFHRAPALNGEPKIFQAMADIVASHLKAGEVCSRAYPLNCAGCTNPTCRTIINPVGPYNRLRDVAQGKMTPSSVSELQ